MLKPDYDIIYFKELITGSDLYYAHLPKKEDKDSIPELLSEHSALVFEYAWSIAEKHSLYGVIGNLINESIPDKLCNRLLLVQKVERLFWRAIAFHDFGKLNHVFQQKKMKNKADILRVEHSFDSNHSVISVYLFLADFFFDFHSLDLSNEEQIFLCNVALYLSYPIYQHHSPTMEEAQDEHQWDNDDLFDLKPYLKLFKQHLNEEQTSCFHCCFLKNANFNFFFDRFNSEIFESHCSFPLYSLIKLNYSLLTASDYLATAHYMNNWKEMLSEFGVMDDNLKRKIIHNTETLKPYNKQVYDAINRDVIMNPDIFTEQNNANLNALRQSIAIEVIENVRKNSEKSLFYIEAPTGSGKTNVSMLALAELLRSNDSNTISKVFYVFPFTTLITQTYKSLCETLGLDVGEIAEIHSRAPYKTDSYDDDYLHYLDNLFMNYPVLLLSHIRFFEVLKTNYKETNYLLHRMANSVVIIDEIQSYSPKIWNKIIYFIANYAKAFNIKFIVMSATLPKIGEIIDNKDLACNFVYLVADKKKYFQNPNFCNRVQFNYSLLSELTMPRTPDDKIIYLERLSKIVIEKSEKYASTNSLYPNSVFTIIEFIFKRTASEFYSLIRSLNNFFDEVLLLSGTILEPRRKQIIDDLKSREKRKKKILLISTQVVEAGVDIDMDLGFKDKSIIDSEEQLAGRINRNVHKKDCALYIFNCDSEKELYSGDERYKIMRNLGVEYERILKDKDFDKLYNQIIKQIITLNGNRYIENISDFMQAVATLNFRSVNNALKLIESPSISVFVPMLIDTQYFNDYRSILEEFHILYEETVSGESVWNSYTSIIQNQDEDFVKNKIQMKKIQSLMSNFTFSIFPNSRDFKILETYGYEKYGYFYLETYKDIYSFEDGINTTILSTSQYL